MKSLFYTAFAMWVTLVTTAGAAASGTLPAKCALQEDSMPIAQFVIAGDKYVDEIIDINDQYDLGCSYQPYYADDDVVGGHLRCGLSTWREGESPEGPVAEIINVFTSSDVWIKDKKPNLRLDTQFTLNEKTYSLHCSKIE